MDAFDVFEGGCIPGMFKCGSILSGETVGVAGVDGVEVFEGVCIPGMFGCGSIFSEEVDGVVCIDVFEGTCNTGIFILRRLFNSRFLTRRFLRIIGLFGRGMVFRFSLALGLGLLMPGIL